MVAAFRRRTSAVEALLPLEMWTYWAEIKKNDYRKKSSIDELVTIETLKNISLQVIYLNFSSTKNSSIHPLSSKYSLNDQQKILVVIIMMINHESMVSGFP